MPRKCCKTKDCFCVSISGSTLNHHRKHFQVEDELHRNRSNAPHAVLTICKKRQGDSCAAFVALPIPYLIVYRVIGVCAGSLFFGGQLSKYSSDFRSSPDAWDIVPAMQQGHMWDRHWTFIDLEKTVGLHVGSFMRVET